MQRKYTHAVVFGRFQPIHKGHEYLIQEALKTADNVLVICGSADIAPSNKNPWSAEERMRMIHLALPNESSRLSVTGAPDFPSDDVWLMNVQRSIDKFIYNGFCAEPKCCIVGHKKDKTSYYLDLFPQYDYVEIDQDGPIDATEVRTFLFENTDDEFVLYSQKTVSAPVLNFIKDWKKSETFQNLMEDYVTVQHYKKIWKFAPYEPKFITGDAVVIESGHILLIQRGEAPFKNCWALPGGHLEAEDILTCCIRELNEETGLKVPKKVLRGSVVGSKVFDKVDRDPRGRYVTHAFHFQLDTCPDPKHKFTPVKPGSDAKKAEWIPLSQVKTMRSKMAFDHYDIIFSMLGE